VKRALAYRNRYFLRAGVAGLVVTALFLAAAGSFRSGSEPDLITWALFVFSIGELVYFSITSFATERVSETVGRARFERGAAPPEPEKPGPFRFRARRLIGQKPPETLEEIGRSLALMGAAFMLHPLLFGTVCLTLSGDAWRQLIFLPVSAIAAAVYWFRIESTLRTLEERGF